MVERAPTLLVDTDVSVPQNGPGTSVRQVSGWIVHRADSIPQAADSIIQAETSGSVVGALDWVSYVSDSITQAPFFVHFKYKNVDILILTYE